MLIFLFFLFFGYIITLRTYSRQTAFGNMKSVIVGFVVYVEVVFYISRLSVKASKLNSQNSIPIRCKFVSILITWQRNDSQLLFYQQNKLMFWNKMKCIIVVCCSTARSTFKCRIRNNYAFALHFIMWFDF